MSEGYIPRKTIDELNAPHVEGERHAAMVKIALSMIGNNISPQAVFAELRSKFPPEKTDSEISGVIDWCIAQNPSPSTPMNGNAGTYRPNVVFPGMAAPRATPIPKKTPEEMQADSLALALDFIADDSIGIDETIARSFCDIGEFQTHGETLLGALYGPEDRINIVCAYTVNEKGKANPQGGGKTLTRDEWIEWFRKEGIPKSKAGAWVRPNPCGDGTGADGAIKDDDIQKLEFMLVESDFLPLDVQLSLYAKWKLPIAAILLSGGDSAHAWVKVSCPDRDAYRDTVARILAAIKPFGFDQSNKNPSRLSRLPGAVRAIGASGGGLQRLLYCNPLTEPLEIVDFEKQVTPPFLNRFPLREVARASVERYEELQKNRGRTGLITGLQTFDRATGGFKRGHFIILAAETNVGKSALALNIINRAVNDGKTSALFTMEMDRDEIFDLLLSINLGVSRDIFNTGNFSGEDVQTITSGSGRISRLPLHIFDDPGMTIEFIDQTCSKLAEEYALAFIVIDYLQLVLPPPFFKDSREQQIAHIGRAIRMMAKRLKVPVLALSQLNEEGKIRESRAVAHDANIVFNLEEDKENKGNLRLRTAKGRSIPKLIYDMEFNGTLCRMRERSRVGA